ncbi:hypothetical protein [Clostridium sp. SHJSY1]|nr:hypothetical protein [Clostridium sp. SHJSY1]
MREKDFYVVNSFGKEAFQGNPAAVFVDASDINSSNKVIRCFNEY